MPVVVLAGQLVLAEVHAEVRGAVRKEVPGEALDLGRARRQRLLGRHYLSDAAPNLPAKSIPTRIA